MNLEFGRNYEPGKRGTAKQVINLSSDTEAQVAQGHTVTEICKRMVLLPQDYFR